eukprot:TRINITY_DN3339_c0_g1_i11.p1 TRINITY_DN3339_c0_g1~~TRINITY_DN3339_c0_g1_i11.p1  ORF type:complete len:184 (+),score=23.54 TRINITY_DN3339_c0_g1_i11:56-607(+)
MFHIVVLCFFFFSSRRRHTRSCLVSWARRCVQETDSILAICNFSSDEKSTAPDEPVTGVVALPPRSFEKSKLLLLIPLTDITPPTVEEGQRPSSCFMSNDKQQSHRSSARPWVVAVQSQTFRPARLPHKEPEGSGTYRADLQWSHVLCVDTCLLYTSDAADDMQCVDLGGRRIIKKKKKIIKR